MSSSSSPLKLKESDPGFISQVSPMKKAKKGTQYFHCSLQTSPTKTFRVLNVNEDNGQYLINQTTTLLQMSNSDVTFTSTDSHHLLQIVTQSSPAVAFNITLNQLPTLTRNQKVNMTGILTLGQKDPKEVKKINGQNGKVKEDVTGSAIIHIWDELIDQVQNNKSYTFKNLSVKNHSGNTMLGSTASTTFDEVQTELKQVKGPDLLENKDKKVTVKEFKFVEKLNIYFQCQIKYCNKTMPYNITANIITCPSCDVDDTETWYPAFTDVLKGLMFKDKQEANLTSDQISEALLSVENASG
ncbi:hypothetical protein P5673_030229 [Acropora cervicornis]|uniref:Uncharacterized protein n=1 Tax=Acropora cervicornis TaxID=6130 RepID=A0AAD9PVG1_ACRCE|nr:hypothetical protein P5673_030229 [Acropora cervicornis]